MSEPTTKFEAALSLAAAIEANQREAAFLKRRLVDLSKAANMLGLSNLGSDLGAISYDLFSQSERLTAAHKAAHLALVGASLEVAA